MTDVNLNGLGVALITPFKKDQSIDFEALSNLIEHIVDGGCDYIVVLGTTAETPTLSLDEKKQIIRFVRERVRDRLPLIIGIGGNNTSGVVKEILSHDLEGYSAILSVTPYYNKPSQEGLFEHFKTIAAVSPLPIILYNVPSRTGVNITSETTIKLAKFTDKICGIKEASGDLKQAIEIIQGTHEKFSLVSGNDADTVSLMSKGASGVISVLANACPSKMKEIVDLCFNQRYEEADKRQQELRPLIGYLFKDGNPAGIKALLHQKNLIDNVLRLPLTPVSQSTYLRLKEMM